MPGLSCAIIDRGNESIQDSAEFVGGSEQAIRLGWKVFQVSRDQKLGFNFDQRYRCLTQEVMELFLGKTSLPFCDVTRYRNGRSPQLIGESVTFLARKSPSHFADFGDELHSFLHAIKSRYERPIIPPLQIVGSPGPKLCDRQPRKMFGFPENREPGTEDFSVTFVTASSAMP